jgi:hypothetical protein
VIELCRSLFDALAVSSVRQPMDNGHTHLTEHSRRKISWPLGCNANSWSVLPSLLCDQVERIQASACKFVTNGHVEKLVRFTHSDD